MLRRELVLWAPSSEVKLDPQNAHLKCLVCYVNCIPGDSLASQPGQLAEIRPSRDLFSKKEKKK